MNNDSSGQDRIVINVLSSWGGHLVFIVAGFILPRAIDRHIGQVALGIWDFSWSIVSYFGLAQIGVGSSVNRYVAMHRSKNEIDELRCSISSVNAVQIVAAFIVLILTIITILMLPITFSERLGPEIDNARAVVGFLGISLVVQILFDVFRGVITGCHRWELHNGLNAASHAISVTGMLIALSLGGGLCSLAFVYMCVVIATELIRVLIAYKVCPELIIRLKYIKFERCKQMMLFGGKTVIEGLSQLLLIQGSSIIVGLYLGPAALAVYSRPNALVRNAQTFIHKYAMVLTPTSGSFHGTGSNEKLRTLFIESSRYGVALVLPIILILSIFSDIILNLWMGPRYANGVVLIILALGFFLPLAQRPTVAILIGMNLHGRVSIINLVLAILGIGMGVVLVGAYDLGLEGAAIAVVIPLTLGNGILIPIFACRSLGIKMSYYIKNTFYLPLLCIIPFFCSLVVVRAVAVYHPWLILAIGFVASILILGSLYWLYILNDSVRNQISVYVEKNINLRRILRIKSGQGV